MTRCCTVVYAVLNLASVWAEGIPSRLCLHHISTYLRICLRHGDAAPCQAVCGCPMLAPRSEPASPALVAACHGDPSSAVVAATEWTTSAALLRATHRRCANCKGVFVKELASCSHCHSPADHFSFTAPAGELAGLARAASSTRRMGRVVTLQGREQPVRAPYGPPNRRARGMLWGQPD